MAENFPQVSGLLLAEVLESLPGRIRKKLDAAPLAAAETAILSLDGAPVLVSVGSETVTFLAPRIDSLDQVHCSCLLSPRCLHLAQALLRGAVVESAAELPGESPKTASATTLTASQHGVLQRSLAAVEKMLASGSASYDPLRHATFLRLSHEAKAQKLFTLSAGCFSLAAALSARASANRSLLVQEVAHVFLTVRRLTVHDVRGTLEIKHLGVPRRSYDTRGALSLQGIFSEPVISSTGYAGVLTQFRDKDGDLWSVNSIMPQEVGETAAAQARQYYRRAPRMGGISTSHQELGRRSLLVGNAKASDDGRLSSSASVSAFAGEVLPWEPGWFTSSAKASPGVDFRTLEVAGLDGIQLVLRNGHGEMLSVQSTAAALEMGAAEDFFELAQRPGTSLHCVLRSEHDTTELLAFEVDPGQIRLPRSWHDRVMVGLDRLAPAYFMQDPVAPLQISPPGRAPWDIMNHWLGKVASRGRAAILSDKTTLRADELMLREMGCVNGAALLEELHAGAHTTRRTFDGTLEHLDEPLARAWLRLAAFAQEWRKAASITDRPTVVD